MQLEFKLTRVTEQQLELLTPLKEHIDIINMINELEVSNKELNEGIFVGYFILDSVFNIMLTFDVNTIQEATEKILTKIFTELEINKTVQSEIKLPKLTKSYVAQ